MYSMAMTSFKAKCCSAELQYLEIRYNAYVRIVSSLIAGFGAVSSVQRKRRSSWDEVSCYKNSIVTCAQRSFNPKNYFSWTIIN